MMTYPYFHLAFDLVFIAVLALFSGQPLISIGSISILSINTKKEGRGDKKE